MIQFVVLQVKATADSPKQNYATEKTPAEKHPRDQVTAAAPLAAEREHPAQSQEGRGGSAPTTQAKRRAKDGNGPVEPKKSRKV